jgi:hypothetical protein
VGIKKEKLKKIREQKIVRSLYFTKKSVRPLVEKTEISVVKTTKEECPGWGGRDLKNPFWLKRI